ncbi:hypothetical protein BH10CYA1_BH10CYA1_13680 [soil metagenome]
MRILIAIDDDHCVPEITSFITKQDWSAKAEFLVLHVLESESRTESDLLFVNDRRHALQLVRQVAIALRDAYRTPLVEERVEVGSAHKKIEEVARRWRADLIVVGSHSKLANIFFGSVSKLTCSNSQCSVLVVRPKAVCA